MVNGLHLYSAFFFNQRPPKVLYNIDQHSPIHANTDGVGHAWRGAVERTTLRLAANPLYLTSYMAPNKNYTHVYLTLMFDNVIFQYS